MVVSIGATFRMERLLATTNPQTPSLQHRGENRVVEKEQTIPLQLQCHMAIAKVIGRLKQLQRRLALHLQEGFFGSGHPNMMGILTIG